MAITPSYRGTLEDILRCEDSMSRMVDFIRKIVRRTGFDIVRYPIVQHEPLNRFLRRMSVDIVLDVGANEGQYARLLRRDGFPGGIISFEPNPGSFRVLEKYANRDQNWSCFNCALGARNGQALLNVAENSAFSSLLESMPYVHGLDPSSLTRTRVRIPVRTLDEFWAEQDLSTRTVLLKLDIQGYEKEALLGASLCLEHMAGIQVEMSLHRIYVGQPQFEEMVPFLAERGFDLYAVWDGFRDHQTGQGLEIDGLFVNERILKSKRVVATTGPCVEVT